MQFLRTYLLTSVFLAFGFLSVVVLQAQEKLILQQENLLFKVSGTSTLHDWNMVSEKGMGFLILESSGTKQSTFAAAEVSFKAETLESGKNGMNKNAYKALKTKQYEDISFEFDEFESTVDGKGFVYGYLTIAGFTKSVTFEMTYAREKNKIAVEAKGHILLTDFQIDPPTALLGTIKTGDELIIEVKAQFKK